MKIYGKVGFTSSFLKPPAAIHFDIFGDLLPSHSPFRVSDDHGHACLTCRKTGSDFGAATALARSTDIPAELVRLYWSRVEGLVSRGGLKKTGVFGSPFKCQQKFLRPIYVWA